MMETKKKNEMEGMREGSDAGSDGRKKK